MGYASIPSVPACSCSPAITARRCYSVLVLVVDMVVAALCSFSTLANVSVTMIMVVTWMLCLVFASHASNLHSIKSYKNLSGKVRQGESHSSKPASM